MAVPRRSGRSRFTLLLLVLTAVTLLTLDYRGFRPIDSIRSGVIAVFSPVGDAVGGLGNIGGGDEQLRQENEQLRQQVEELQGQVASGQAAQRELDELRKQLDLPFVGENPTVRARVVSGAIANFDDTIEIDKGSSAGIDKGMAVVSGGGLVGQVVRVSGDRAVVKLISDRGFQVGVRVAGEPGLGVVQGQGDEFRLKATEFDVSAQLAENDILVTSGASRSQFPPDIPVGTVQAVTTNEQALLKEADVRPLANLSDLTYVTVIQYRPSDEEGS